MADKFYTVYIPVAGYIKVTGVAADDEEAAMDTATDFVSDRLLVKETESVLARKDPRFETIGFEVSEFEPQENMYQYVSNMDYTEPEAEREDDDDDEGDDDDGDDDKDDD